MARPIWTGSIAFGLVNVPVKVFPAVSQKEVRFNMLHAPDGGRVRQKRVCTQGGHEVPFEEVAKGYELSPDRYVVLTQEELQALQPPGGRTIDIEDFVGIDEIDPIFWERTYYLVPDRGADKAYALLYHALKRTHRVGIARVVMRTKQYLCTLRPLGRAIALSTMQYADEIVPQAELEGLPKADVKPRERELEMAEQLVESLSAKFEPEKYKDDHRERVLELIQKKSEGEEIVAPPEEVAPAKVVNLMEALEASLAAGRRATEERGERRQRAEAARERRTAPKKKSSRSKKGAA